MSLEELVKKLDQLNAEWRKRERTIEESEEYLQLEKEHADASHNTAEVLELLGERRQPVYRQFLTDGGSAPWYAKHASKWRRTNIAEPVLDAMKEILGSFTKLSDSNIEHIVQQMIETTMMENEEIANLTKKHDELRTQSRSTWEKMSEIKRKFYHENNELLEEYMGFRAESRT